MDIITKNTELFGNKNIIKSSDTNKCIPGYYYIHTKNGLKKIKDINDNDKVLTTKGYKNIKKKVVQDKQHLSTIYTSNGEFKCTPNHRMAVVDNIYGYKWVESQNLKEGDILLTVRKPIEGIETILPKNEFSKSKKQVVDLTPDVAWFIGIFNEAGNYNTDYISDSTFVSDLTSFNITVYGFELIETIKNFIRKFDNNAKCSLKRLYDENIYTIVCNSEELSQYFNKYFKYNNNTFEIPSFIKEGTLDIRKAYIAGIIDGNVSNYDKGFVITKTNKVRADELQNICYSCGFETTNIYINNKSSMTNTLKVSTYFSMNVINSIKELHKSINYDDIYHINNSFPVKMVKDFIEDEYNTNIISDIDINNKCVYELFNKLNIDNIKSVNINDFDKYVITLNYCPSVITKVVFDCCMVEETYYIDIENNHEFYCNGYLTNNSV